MNDFGTAKTPWHLWAVGVVSLAWNCFGALDYVMSVTRNAAYLANFSEEVVAFLDNAPAWSTGAWALGVWASVLGSVLLLARSRYAAPVFLASIIGAAVSFVYQYTADLPAEMTEGIMGFMPIVILVLIVAQWYYARRMAAAGVLR